MSRPEPVALAGCGGRKAAGRCRADQMYTGTYSRLAWAAALALCPGRSMFISARHGLLLPWQEIGPYEQRMDRGGAVDWIYVQRQAVKLGIIDAPVTVLAGRAYADVIARAWHPARVARPLAGLGIGEQLHELAGIAARGALA